MDRRTLLKLMAATALAGAVSPVVASKLRVTVAGAGIVGASIAYHLAKAGAAVMVIDRVGPASHASRGTFAWVNATYAKQPRDYHRLTQESLSTWHSLSQDLKIPMRWGGSLEWFTSKNRQARLRDQIAEQVTWGEDARMVSLNDVQEMEPGLVFPGVQDVALSANDGAVDPILATRLLLDAAQKLGARVVAPCTLEGVKMNSNRLVAVNTSQGDIVADRLILATGADPVAAERFALTDLPQRTRPGVIAISKPTRRRMNHIISAPGVHMHQRSDNRIVFGEQDGAPETHFERLQGRPNDFPTRERALEHANRILAIAEEFAPGISDVDIEDVYIGWRPLPLDGHPVIGASPNRPDVYLAVMHSGVSLAPIAGQLAAQEVVSGRTTARLAAYRPGRDFKIVKRY